MEPIKEEIDILEKSICLFNNCAHLNTQVKVLYLDVVRSKGVIIWNECWAMVSKDLKNETNPFSVGLHELKNK